jgi:membrane protein implicated in regulation of membrane protease activity
MRKQPPAFRQVASLTVLAGLGMAGLLTPWAWAQVLAVSLVVAIVLFVAARQSLRRASRQIDEILEDELDSDNDEAPAPHDERLAS